MDADLTKYASVTVDKYLETIKIQNNLLEWTNNKKKIESLLKQYPHREDLKKGLKSAEELIAGYKKELERLQM